MRRAARRGETTVPSAGDSPVEPGSAAEATGAGASDADGDTVRIVDGRVYVNDVPLGRPAAAQAQGSDSSWPGPAGVERNDDHS